MPTRGHPCIGEIGEVGERSSVPHPVIRKPPPRPVIRNPAPPLPRSADRAHGYLPFAQHSFAQTLIHPFTQPLRH